MRRVFLFPFPALALVMGLAYVFGSPARTAASSFAVARSIAPMDDWGLMFISGAVFITVAMALRSTQLVSGSLFVGGMIYTWWAVLFASAALTDARASLTAPAIHATIALWHYITAWRVRVPA